MSEQDEPSDQMYAYPESINWEASWSRMKAERDSLRKVLAESVKLDAERVRDLTELREQLAARDGVIAKAAEAIKSMEVLEGSPSYGVRLAFGEVEKVQAILNVVPEAVLADVKAQVLEGAAGVVRAYRFSTSEYVASILDERAAKYRNGATHERP